MLNSIKAAASCIEEGKSEGDLTVAGWINTSVFKVEDLDCIPLCPL